MGSQGSSQAAVRRFEFCDHTLSIAEESNIVDACCGEGDQSDVTWIGGVVLSRALESGVVQIAGRNVLEVREGLPLLHQSEAAATGRVHC